MERTKENTENSDPTKHKERFNITRNFWKQKAAAEKGSESDHGYVSFRLNGNNVPKPPPSQVLDVFPDTKHTNESVNGSEATTVIKLTMPSKISPVHSETLSSSTSDTSDESTPDYIADGETDGETSGEIDRPVVPTDERPSYHVNPLRMVTRHNNWSFRKKEKVYYTIKEWRTVRDTDKEESEEEPKNAGDQNDDVPCSSDNERPFDDIPQTNTTHQLETSQNDTGLNEEHVTYSKVQKRHNPNSKRVEDGGVQMRIKNNPREEQAEKRFSARDMPLPPIPEPGIRPVRPSSVPSHLHLSKDMTKSTVTANQPSVKITEESLCEESPVMGTIKPSETPVIMRVKPSRTEDAVLENKRSSARDMPLPVIPGDVTKWDDDCQGEKSTARYDSIRKYRRNEVENFQQQLKGMTIVTESGKEIKIREIRETKSENRKLEQRNSGTPSGSYASLSTPCDPPAEPKIEPEQPKMVNTADARDERVSGCGLHGETVSSMSVSDTRTPTPGGTRAPLRVTITCVMCDSPQPHECTPQTVTDLSSFPDDCPVSDRRDAGTVHKEAHPLPTLVTRSNPAAETSLRLSLHSDRILRAANDDDVPSNRSSGKFGLPSELDAEPKLTRCKSESNLLFERERQTYSISDPAITRRKEPVGYERVETPLRTPAQGSSVSHRRKNNGNSSRTQFTYNTGYQSHTPPQLVFNYYDQRTTHFHYHNHNYY